MLAHTVPSTGILFSNLATHSFLKIQILQEALQPKNSTQPQHQVQIQESLSDIIVSIPVADVA